jgi:uncharacterized cupin superfamily protein
MTSHPVAVRRTHLDGENLPEIPLWPSEMMPRPVASNRNKVWYAGEDLICMVYEADDGVVAFADLPYDEQVQILNGRAVLTSADGRTDVFEQGDVFVAPKGWTGTWEMLDGYRELISFHTRSLREAAAVWWPGT